MINALIGTKINQSKDFTPEGVSIPVTKILLGQLKVVRVKTVAKDGYTAVQLATGQKRIKNITQPEQGNLKKAGLDKAPPRFLKEIRVKDADSIDADKVKPGISLDIADILSAGDHVSVTGVSKGKGFQGVVKRHGFAGGPRTHGQSDRERAPGSIGQTTTPGRVYKGKRMAGRMGNHQVTVKNLKVISIDKEKQILTISGLVPGARNSLLVIRKS